MGDWIDVRDREPPKPNLRPFRSYNRHEREEYELGYYDRWYGRQYEHSVRYGSTGPYATGYADADKDAGR